MRFEKRMLDASRFQNADEYVDYLKTPSGRLRSELAWENLRRFLPSDTSKRQALDIGGGTGFASVQLARMGYKVMLLDLSKEMLRIACELVGHSSVPTRISFCNGDANRLTELFDADSFDVIVCHNMLEFSENPSAIVRGINNVKSRNCKTALANLTAETVLGSLYGEPVRVFSLAEIRELLTRAGLEIVAEHGVRVFCDYIDLENLAAAEYSQIFELESTLGTRPEFAAIARYIQVIARRSGASSSEVRRS
jgi:S-adenosylmethionine-dependent methyltransferase